MSAHKDDLFHFVGFTAEATYREGNNAAAKKAGIQESRRTVSCVPADALVFHFHLLLPLLIFVSVLRQSR